ncbi:MAG: M23 family metallopeptidase [Candidatus Cloacimonetes bacterium]|jgi:murein DD-endopeptidase MepM/ murein hydrolase activator NlpD|nr:M23 family metallopeptidase [Candidatus Cloacimonadota bacterium]MDD4155136.1 M23 family metallopeptidase [Candidatus Cloacimonadota bacterium]
MLNSNTFLRIVVIILLMILLYAVYLIHDLSKSKINLNNEVKNSNEIVNILKEKLNVVLDDVDSLKLSKKEIRVIRETLVMSDTLSMKAKQSVPPGVSLNNRFIPDLVPIHDNFALSQEFSEYHQSIDLATTTGTTVHASAAGIVIACYNDKYLGNVILIDHLNGYKTLYAHLHEFISKINDFVEKGQAIGLVGNTGYSTNSHLHFQIYYQNNPVDPATLMKIPTFKM